jgi:hypothetical protein
MGPSLSLENGSFVGVSHVEAAVHKSRIVVQFEGRGIKKYPQPSQEGLDRASRVIVVRFLETG